MTSPGVTALAVATILSLSLSACSSSGSEPGAAAPDTVDAVADAGPVASVGCEGDAPAAGRSEVSVASGGRQRGYVRYVPGGLEAGRPAPLVVDFTAYSPATLQEGFSGFTKPDADGVVKADEVGAVVVTPEPVNGAGSLLTWNIADTEGWTDDQAFVSDLLDHVGSQTCVDTDGVVVMGFAIGGVMASTVACEQADRVSALITVAGLWSPEGCAPSRPVPVLSFHGSGDRFLPFDGGVGSGVGGLGLTPETSAGLVDMLERPGAVNASAAWAGHNGCEVEPTVDPVAETVSRQTWPDCDDGAATELYVVDGGSHTWPGSNGMEAFEDLLGPVSDAVVANDVIGDFVAVHVDP